MPSTPRPISIVAERAVRYLRDAGRPVDSVRMARDILSTSTPDEPTAKRVLDAAFSGDPRLAYDGQAWMLATTAPRLSASGAVRPLGVDPERALLFIQGEPAARGRPFRLIAVSALRLSGDDVISACGGDAIEGPRGRRLRRAILETLEGAVPLVHDPPGGLAALETWLAEPFATPISLRRLAQERLGLPARHDLEALAAQLGLSWRECEDPLEQAETLDQCLAALRRPGESMQDLQWEQVRDPRPIDWSRFAFRREFLQRIPRIAGTYRFYDDQGRLLYVGKSNNLSARINSYFRAGRGRSDRVQKLLDGLYRIEYEATGSDLEAMLREAEQIRRDRPAANIQRRLNAQRNRAARLLSILILEPAAPPSVLRAFLIRDGRLLARVGIGSRGGGLGRIARILDDWFFSGPAGPTPVVGPDLDVEVVARWLAAHRDRVVAFDPTDLRTSKEVIERLRWFLAQGGPFSPDGTPILSR